MLLAMDRADRRPLPALAAALIALALAPAAQADVLSEMAGLYRLVDLRRNGTVAAPAPPPGAPAPAPAMGIPVEIGPGPFTLNGVTCAAWTVAPAEGAALFQGDPVLADLHLGPNAPPATRGDSRIGTLHRLSCGGAYVTTLYRAGPRVFVATRDNETVYAIYERPLSPAQIARLQRHLRDTKVLTGGADGVLDGATIAALRRWLEGRQDDPALPLPARPAITANLLDGTGVLE